MGMPKSEAHVTVLPSSSSIVPASRPQRTSSLTSPSQESERDAGPPRPAPTSSPANPAPNRVKPLRSIFLSRTPHDFDVEGMSLDDIAPDAITTIKSNVSNLYTTPLWKKSAITSLAGWCTVCASVSSTSLLGAAEEITNDLNTSKSMVTLSTGGLLFAMALSGFIWGPLHTIFGRRLIYNVCLAVLFAFTAAAAMAENMPQFVALRVLSGFQGCYFQITGQSILSEYFPPETKGTAMGFYLAVTMLGSPLGPFIAGMMVTYADWRSILWLQTAMIGIGLGLSIFFIPAAATDRGVLKVNMAGRKALAQFNPLPVFRVMKHPNILLTHLSCGFLGAVQYSLLAAPRHVLKVNYGLDSPLKVGLFYLSPVGGFLVGTILGGVYSDYTVRKWKATRDRFLPQDRLRSTIFSYFCLIPPMALLYGWGITCSSAINFKGDTALVLPAITSFFIAAGLLGAFASMNTYCNEAIPEQQKEVVGGKYFIQFSFTALSTATAIPIIEAIGIGHASTIGAVVVLLAGFFTLMVAIYGEAMQDWRWRDTKQNCRDGMQNLRKRIRRPFG